MSMIEEATILEEFEGLGEGRSFQDVLINGFDKLTKNKKATALTEALILADVVEDPASIRAAVQSNTEAFNQYFEAIDFDKFSKNYGDQVLTPIVKNFGNRIRESLPFLLTGMAIGGTLTAFIKAKNK